MATRYYSMKRSDEWRFDGRYTADDVIARVSEEQLGDDWLVAPFASTESPVDVLSFVADPEVFENRQRKRREIANRRKDIADSVPTPVLLQWGKRGLGAFFAFMVIGRMIISVFFPNLVGGGMTPIAWAILIPAWTVGGVSLLATGIGAAQNKARIANAIAAAEEAAS